MFERTNASFERRVCMSVCVCVYVCTCSEGMSRNHAASLAVDAPLVLQLPFFGRSKGQFLRFDLV